jgi:hypothetical protein
MPYTISLTDSYLEDSPHACPRQADVNRVNVCDNVTYSLEPIQEPHDLIRLLKQVYLAVFVGPCPSLNLGALLKLSCVGMHFVESIFSTHNVCGLQRNSYSFSVIRPKGIEGVC